MECDHLFTNKLYPALAGLYPSLDMYKDNMTLDVARRYKELGEGRPENWFDTVLREKVYPILAWVQSLSSKNQP